MDVRIGYKKSFYVVRYEDNGINAVYNGDPDKGAKALKSFNNYKDASHWAYFDLKKKEDSKYRK